MTGTRKKTGTENRKVGILALLLSFFIPFFGIFFVIRNWKKNVFAARVYAVATVAGFALNYFVMAPMVL